MEIAETRVESSRPQENRQDDPPVTHVVSHRPSEHALSH